MAASSMSHKSTIALSAVLIFLVLFFLAAYTLIHEGGHAIAGLLFGGELTSFNTRFWDLSAHVSIANDEHFSTLQKAVVSASGVSLPIVVWLVILIAVPRKGNMVLEWFKLLGTMNVFGSLLVWVAFPIMYLAQGTAPGDDSTNFLRITALPPLLVCGSALVILSVGLLTYRTRSDDFSQLRITVKSLPEGGFTREAVHTIRVLLAVGVVMAFLRLAVGMMVPEQAQLAVPDGYRLVKEIDLSGKGYELEQVYEITGKTSEQAKFFLVLTDVTCPCEIGLLTPDHTRRIFLRDPNNSIIGHATVSPDVIQLDEGEYSVYLTAPRGRGKVQIHLRNGF